MGATFHLNSGMYGDKTYEGRIGNLGMMEKPASVFDPKARHLLAYVPHFRIPEDEVKQVYEGFEIASHTCHHVNLSRCTEEVRKQEIAEDVQALQKAYEAGRLTEDVLRTGAGGDPAGNRECIYVMRA